MGRKKTPACEVCGKSEKIPRPPVPAGWSWPLYRWKSPKYRGAAWDGPAYCRECSGRVQRAAVALLTAEQLNEIDDALRRPRPLEALEELTVSARVEQELCWRADAPTAAVGA